MCVSLYWITKINTEEMFHLQWNLGLGTPKGLSKTALNSDVVLFLRSISMYWIGIGTEAAVLNSQAVPISQVVLKTGFTVLSNRMAPGSWRLTA